MHNIHQDTLVGIKCSVFSLILLFVFPINYTEARWSLHQHKICCKHDMFLVCLLISFLFMQSEVSSYMLGGFLEGSLVLTILLFFFTFLGT